MTATLTKLTSAPTAQGMQAMLAQSGGKIHSEPHALGFEIRDFRPLVDRVMSPIRGRGILRTLGATHFIVSEVKAAALGLI